MPHDSDRTTAPEAADHTRRGSAKGSLLRWLNPDGVDWGANVGDFDPEAVRLLRRSLSTVFGDGRPFPVSVSGWEHLPSSPAMLVSNHSGGTLFLDAWGLLYAWYGHFGTERPLHPAAHEIILGNRVTGRFFAKRGVIRADRHVARRVVNRWREDLLVMPGGDIDVWRPYRRRYEVEFAGRRGYAKLALETGTPVVPLANAGAQETFYVLTDGRRIADLLRLKRFARASIWPVHLSLPWGLAVGPWPHLPVPTRLRYRFGAPIDPRAFHEGDGAASESAIEAFDAAVRAEVQAQLHALRDE